MLLRMVWENRCFHQCFTNHNIDENQDYYLPAEAPKYKTLVPGLM
jgi:hypothetical protein